MAGNNDLDQDAIAAQWEASLDSEDPAEAAKSAAANELTETMAEQWAAMVDDGSRNLGTGKNGGERVLSQEEIDNLLGFSVGEINIDDMIGQELPLERINEAFDLMHDGKVIRSVIRF